ncbi:DNA dC-_dU-editing enzyme APOBEC-3C-like [Acipenser oxyrinchus oxyrinchus]|uniref:DNA dC->dU-editing enzyme APOBEC-3C-like n=1 Tax=Acipenser oxyrinchus oxyrinchus TaxID=40147 RepID=A0AAD8CHV1_ACIOX|nr:DNA dC->dU-editing enzyme APOBEC-3C-like [Acipenser oxyrinchus oxyrinchus]
MNRIPVDVFNFQFENLQLADGRKETWLCQIRSVNGGEAALQVFKNDETGHAEEICLRENEAAIQGADRYEITWYMSWSPASPCESQIIDFVEQHPNVKLNIFVSRLYYHQLSPHREGLKALSQHERIGLKVMTLADFQVCFDRFVEFKPWGKLEEDSRFYAEKLKEITVRTSDNHNAVFKQDLYTESRDGL